MRKFLCLLFIFCSSVFASEMKLKDKLTQAKPGGYLVLEQNKTFTLLHIHDCTETTVVIEEVSIPTATFARRPMPWKQWFEQGAPGHTAWLMSQVNLETGVFEETFSFKHKGWIDMSDSNPFLTTLLNLRFRELDTSERRRIGLPPGYNKVDHRPIWNPRLVVDGRMLDNAQFAAYQARWPADGTDMSRKIIEIYLPLAQENTWFPVYFPYWLEVEGKIGSAKIRVVDSGTGARSPKEYLPKKSPQLIGEATVREDGLVFQLSSPPYYREFMLVAEMRDSFFNHSFPIPCETFFDTKGTLCLLVLNEELKKSLEPGVRYHFLISPKDEPSLVLETRSAFKIDAL